MSAVTAADKPQMFYLFAAMTAEESKILSQALPLSLPMHWDGGLPPKSALEAFPAVVWVEDGSEAPASKIAQELIQGGCKRVAVVRRAPSLMECRDPMEFIDRAVVISGSNVSRGTSVRRKPRTQQEISAARDMALRPVTFGKLSDISKGIYAPKVPLFASDAHSILFPGAHLIVGRPKIGKSWLLLQLALCATQGDPFLRMQPMRGNIGALMICAEDDEARIKGRLEALGVGTAPDNCYVITWEEFRYIASVRSPYQTFSEFLDQWLTENSDVKLVLIDTETTCMQTWLGEQTGDDGRRITETDYKQTRAFDALALKHGAIIGLVNHTSKRKGEMFDIHELINRTNTALAGASGSLVLADMPGADLMDTASKQRILGARGRDMKDDILLCVQQEKDLPMFTCLGEYAAVQQTQTETQILEAVEEFQNEEQMPGRRYNTAEIAEHLCMKRAAVKRAISRMMAKPSGKYWKKYLVDVKTGRGGGIMLVG